MPRTRRQIESKACYEICFRAKKGLPFAAYKIMRLVIGAAVARTQRDDKVILCHDIWNGSHSHQIIVTRDAEGCTKFYGEVQKRITDMLKRLLGIKHLELWEGRASVIKLLDVETVIDRIAYLYANPAQDNLTTNIEEFPGVSSWDDFKQSLNKLSDSTSERFPWIRLSRITKLPSRTLSPQMDLDFTTILEKDNEDVYHSLRRHPNAWMSCFGVESDKEVKRINNAIIGALRTRELTALTKYKRAGKSPIGSEVLCKRMILKPHTPKNRERKLFVLGSRKETRCEFIKNFKEFCLECTECFELMRRGELKISWPVGAFRPPLRPSENILKP